MERKEVQTLDKQDATCGGPLTPEEILIIKEGDEELLEACLQQGRTGMQEIQEQ